jgi:hypothetical protein
MIKEADKGGDKKKAVSIMKAYKDLLVELKLFLNKA